MRFLPHIVLLALALTAAACTSRELDIVSQEDTVVTDNGIALKVSSLQQGKIRIYVSEEQARQIEADPESFIRDNTDLAITGIHRTFPYEEEFEERTRESGLHRWYDVEFDTEVPLTKAGSELRGARGVCKVEYRPRIRRHEWSDASWKHGGRPGAFTKAGNGLPFDDPYLEEQWHYRNTGSHSGLSEGCDVNVFPAWQEFRSGREDIIVAVVDGGIDFRHEDLAANMWHNPEQSGDRVYGYNFMRDSYRITAEEHGTHVAGTISAINNNGIGVCGIAGGDAARGIPGVRLMSCQIFEQNSEDSGDDVPAIKWAADHGAVICQNSWAYDDTFEMPASSKAAIDYFNKYAGCDKLGNQTGPMKGGLVIFAAGNEHSKDKVYPACYEGVLSVSALGSDFRLATYSNYGDWVSIAAPGGDDNNEILSTVQGNDYAWFSGTSMATPHVSGVAALVIANMGGEGFTRDNLIDVLMRHTTDISSYNPHKYPGVGLVNAYESISRDPGSARFSISGVSASASGRTVNAIVSAQAVDGGDDSWISGARIYYSSDPFTSVDGIPYINCAIRKELDEGPFDVTTGALEYESDYYVAFVLYDEFGNCTQPSETVALHTSGNLPPVIEPAEPLDGLDIGSHEQLVLDFVIKDPYGDAVTTILQSSNKKVVSMKQDGENVKITIRGNASQPGSYSFTLIATDEYSLATSLTVYYTVLENRPPQLLKTIEDMIVPAGKAIDLDLGEYFHDPDGETPSYTASTDNTGVLRTRVVGNTISLIPQQYGYVTVTVTAADNRGETASCTFKMLIRDESVAAEIYPNPTTDGRIFIRVGQLQAVEYEIRNAVGSIIVSSSAAIDPFEPQMIDLSGCAAGVFKITVKTSGETITKEIVKL
ncbi:MAG: S8 family serine peptidase [Bacteroidales bacterium]|nr:S8 family serine peptidase [Bacteroidales bacterium]